MKAILFFVNTILLYSFMHAQNRTALIVAGGHQFDTVAFSGMFDQLEGIGYDMLLQPEANRFIAGSVEFPYDIIIFYDMWKSINEEEINGYLRLTEMGKPMLFLHHSLVSYQDWPEFENIIGGRYVETRKVETREKSGLSTYRHDVWIDIKVLDKNHPVTRGMENFRLFDEVYGNYRVGPAVIPLLQTDHPESTPVIAWENRYKNSRIIYLQPGHDGNTFKDPHFRNLVRQSVAYLLNN